MARLQLHHIVKKFPGVKALTDVSLSVEQAEIHALCGENGAGKSTLMNILAGNLQPDEGTIELENQTITIPSPRNAFDKGIAIVYQHLSLIDSLSVAENIYANQQPRNSWGLIQFDRLYNMTQALLDSLQINSIHPTTIVSKLSTPQKQLVEIAKALSRKPTILILDEPTASLTDREVNVLFPLLKKLKTEGVSVIYISHRLEEIFQLADRVTVLKDGKSQGTFLASELDKARLIKLMVGRDITNLKGQSSSTDRILLEVKNLTSSRFKNISFQLREGEILGLAGLVGAGRTEIARAIFGADEFVSGKIYLHTTEYHAHHPADSIAQGVAYVAEDRKQLGLFLDMTIQDNVVAASLENAVSRKLYSHAKAEQFAVSYKEKLKIASPDVARAVNMLSGGNQQKVVLAKWLLTNPQMLIVDEPTHGVDVGAKFEIYEILKSLAKQGKGIIVISSELPELISLCDRILAVNKGSLAGEVTGANATEEKILELAAN
jgi:ABC-type sugar transport system ATPase subunit